MKMKRIIFWRLFYTRLAQLSWDKFKFQSRKCEKFSTHKIFPRQETRGEDLSERKFYANDKTQRNNGVEWRISCLVLIKNCRKKNQHQKAADSRGHH